MWKAEVRNLSDATEFPLRYHPLLLPPHSAGLAEKRKQHPPRVLDEGEEEEEDKSRTDQRHRKKKQPARPGNGMREEVKAGEEPLRQSKKAKEKEADQDSEDDRPDANSERRAIIPP